MGFELLHLSGTVLVKLVAPDLQSSARFAFEREEERLSKARAVPRSKIPRALYHRKSWFSSLLVVENAREHCYLKSPGM